MANAASTAASFALARKRTDAKNRRRALDAQDAVVIGAEDFLLLAGDNGFQPEQAATCLHSRSSKANSSSMCSGRVRKFTGLMRNQMRPLSSVVEIQKRPPCSMRRTTSACSRAASLGTQPL